MSPSLQPITVTKVEPVDASVSVYGTSALVKIGDVYLLPSRGNLNANCGAIVQTGERIARQARRAGHRRRTELRTRLLLEALEW